MVLFWVAQVVHGCLRFKFQGQHSRHRLFGSRPVLVSATEVRLSERRCDRGHPTQLGIRPQHIAVTLPQTTISIIGMSFDSDAALQHECCCGRVFLQTNAYGNHQKSCKKTRTRLSSALSSARDSWQRIKRARTVGPSEESHQPELASASLPQPSGNSGVFHPLHLSSEPGTGTENLTTPPGIAQHLHGGMSLPVTEHSEAIDPSHEVNSPSYNLRHILMISYLSLWRIYNSICQYLTANQTGNMPDQRGTRIRYPSHPLPYSQELKIFLFPPTRLIPQPRKGPAYGVSFRLLGTCLAYHEDFFPRSRLDMTPKTSKCWLTLWMRKMMLLWTKQRPIWIFSSLIPIRILSSLVTGIGALAYRNPRRVFETYFPLWEIQNLILET